MNLKMKGSDVWDVESRYPLPAYTQAGNLFELRLQKVFLLLIGFKINRLCNKAHQMYC